MLWISGLIGLACLAGGGGCEVEEINFLLCDLEENDQHAGSIFGGKRTCIRDCPELQIRWVQLQCP